MSAAWTVCASWSVSRQKQRKAVICYKVPSVPRTLIMATVEVAVSVGTVSICGGCDVDYLTEALWRASYLSFSLIDVVITRVEIQRSSSDVFMKTKQGTCLLKRGAAYLSLLARWPAHLGLAAGTTFSKFPLLPVQNENAGEWSLPRGRLFFFFLNWTSRLGLVLALNLNLSWLREAVGGLTLPWLEGRIKNNSVAISHEHEDPGVL